MLSVPVKSVLAPTSAIVALLLVSHGLIVTLGAPVHAVVSGAPSAGPSSSVSIAAVVTLSASPSPRVGPLGPPLSATNVPANTPFYLEIWATSNSASGDGLACVYAEVQVHPAGAVLVTAPVQDSPLFPIDVVPAVVDTGAGLVHDVGGCQTIPAIGDLGIAEWVLIKTIEMSTTSSLGEVNLSVMVGSNVFAGTSIIGDVNGVGAGDVSLFNAMFNVDCAFGTISDLAAVSAFQRCFTGQGAGSPFEPICQPFDADCDLDTDLNDFAGLAPTLSGP